jgi:uncharacterized protein YbdZ (MbtH family)
MKRLLIIVLLVSTSPLGIASAHTTNKFNSIERVSVKAYAYKALNNPKQFACMDYVITKESHWNPLAKNPYSSAFGIGQMLGEKSRDPFIQLAKVLRYAEHRYSTWCNAMAHHLKKGWY